MQVELEHLAVKLQVYIYALSGNSKVVVGFEVVSD